MSNVIYRRTKGDTFAIKATLTRNGVAVPLDDALVVFNFKSTRDSGSLTGVVTGIGQVTFTPLEDTFNTPGDFRFNIKATKGTEITTYLKGIITIEDDL